MSSKNARVLVATAGVLMLITSGARLGAQSEATTIPVSLATELIVRGGRAPGIRSARYVVAALPTGWPADLVPPAPATVMGGMLFGSNLVAVFADTGRQLSPGHPPLFLRYVHLIQDAGFHKPPPRMASGFEPALDGYAYYCRDSATVTVTTTPPRMHVVHVTYQPEGASSCLTPQPTPQPAEALVLPALRAPASASSRRSGSSTGSDELTASTRLLGRSLDPAAIAAHYAAQLVAAGWTASTVAANDGVAVQAFQARDKRERPWSGALVVVRTGAALDVSLTMRPEEDR